MISNIFKFMFSAVCMMCFYCLPLYAQDDAWSALDSLEEGADGFASATFKGTRLVNFQTIEVAGKRTLDFRISHRFGELSSGSYNLYGIDGPANIRLGLEYSYEGRFMAGIGRSSYQKQFDGFLKYRLYRQTITNKMPVSITLFTSVFMTSLKDPNKSTTGFDKYDPVTNRLSYAHQVIVARKFTSAFSMQIAPVMVHYNMVEEFTDRNDMFFITAAARMKITRRMAITAEYGYSLNDYSKRKDYINPLGIGIDIETGGHVFQVHLTNAFGITENQFLPYNTSSWKDSDMRVGFNISRVFTI
jgi:hypothetical protein